MSEYLLLIVIGLFYGSIYGLGALGLVLTYKTTGVFNFAYGAVAMFSAYVYWQLHDSWHVTAWIALPLLLLVVAPLVGAMCEALFRPLAGLSAEVPLAVAIALLALFEGGAGLLWPHQNGSFETVIPTSTFKLGSLYVGWDQLGTLVTLVLAGVVLWLSLRHTRFGTATRAVVDNGALSSMIGVNGASVRRTAWAISSMFAGVVGVLISHTQGLNNYNLVLVVLASFTPAVIARLTSFPWAFGSALGMGVLMNVLDKWRATGWVANLVSAIPWILLFGALVVLGGKLKEAGVSVRPMGGGSVSDSFSGAGRRASGPAQRPVALGVAAFALAVLLPAILSGSDIYDLTYGAIWALIAVTLVVLTGWAGQISLCQFSFVGIGAFAIGHLAGAHGGNFVGATVAGMVIAVGASIVVGGAAVRLKGLFLALATLAFALIMDYAVFQTVGISGGFSGMFDSPPRLFGVSFASTTSLYELSVCVLGVVLAAAFFLSRGPVGRRLRILRDSPLAASTLGVNLTVTKLVTFAACGALAALGGALYGADLRSINPYNFQFSESLELLLLVVFMGRTRLTAAVLAGLVATEQLFFPNPTITTAVNFGVALGVIGLGRNPEGTIAIAFQEARRTLSVMRPRPRRPLELGSLLVQPRTGVHSGV